MSVVSKARELEQRLARTEHQLGMMQRLSRYLVRDIPVEKVLQSVVEMVVEFMECDSCLLYLFEENEKELVLRAFRAKASTSISASRSRSRPRPRRRWSASSNWR